MELVMEARRHGLKVLAWTVDEPTLMSRMIANGVDGIMTNYPDRLSALIR
jgi:glycerophosphoryl diester phosphodiesterase